MGYREPILNKVFAFVTDPAIYRILCQSRSTINFRKVMDEGNWVLMNMSKGHLKGNMGLLGTIFLTKMKQAALSRIDTPEAGRRPFSVFIDEFQNFAEENIAETLSESRKFRLGLVIAHQYLDQLPANLRAAILGNATTEIFFRLSHRDASQVSAEMDQREKGLIEKGLIDLKVGQAYLKIKGTRPMLMKTLYVPSVIAADEWVETLRQASFQHWTRPIEEVDAEITERKNHWTADEFVIGPPMREPRRDQSPAFEPLVPEGPFKEGQSEW